MRFLPLLSMETNLTRKLLPEHYDPSRTREICVRAGSGWKSVLEKVTLERRGPPGGPQCCPMTSDGRSKDDPTLVLATSKDDIICLWEGEAIQALKKRGVHLEY